MGCQSMLHLCLEHYRRKDRVICIFITVLALKVLSVFKCILLLVIEDSDD